MSSNIQIQKFPRYKDNVIYVDLRKLIFSETQSILFVCENCQIVEQYKLWLWKNIQGKTRIYWLLRDLIDHLRFNEQIQINFYNLEESFGLVLMSCLNWMLNSESNLKFIRQDILNINHGIICQQVNTKKVMGKGLAYAIRRRFPNVYVEYMGKEWELSDIQLIQVNSNLFVCNIAGQESYGNDKRYTNFSALSQGLEKLAAIAQSMDVNVYFPWRFGSNNAGGGNWEEKIETWDNILEIIAQKIPQAIICKK